MKPVFFAPLVLLCAVLRSRFAIWLTLLMACSALECRAADGDLDSSFGTGGKVTTDFGGGWDVIESIALDANGRILAGGHGNLDSSPGGLNNFALARYTASGALDTSFGTGGKVTADFYGIEDFGAAVVVDGSGRILVVGFAKNPVPGDFETNIALVRFTAAGALDTSFGTGGKVLTDFFGENDIAYATAIDSNGRILVAGGAQTGENISTRDFALVRYTATGALDATFGSGGKVTTDFFGEDDIAHTLVIDTNGRIVVAGQTINLTADAGGLNFALARFMPNGTLDSSFGNGGKVTADFDGRYDGAEGLALDSSGKIILSGFSGGGGGADNFNLALIRFTSTGSPDASFGSGGKVITSFGGGEYGNSVIVEASGRIVVAGAASIDSNDTFDFGVFRYTSAGVLDSSFGTGGKVMIDMLGSQDGANAVALTPDGSILAGGSATIPSSSSDRRFALVRLLSNQTPEISLSFGGGAVGSGGNYSFGTPVQLGEERSVTITVSNSGNAPLSGIAASVPAPGNNHFRIGTPPPASVAAGGSATLTVIFDPQNTGSLTGTLQVTSNAAPSPYLVQLSGTGVDTINPVIGTQAANLTVVDGAAGNAATINAWLSNHGGASATDNSGSVTWSHNYTAPPVPGTAATITFTASDAAGNSAATAAQLIVLDQTPPVITVAPAPLTVACDDPDKTNLVNAWLDDHGTASATDNSGSFTWSHNYTTAPAACGTVTITFKATDPSGNFSTSPAILTVVDNTAPAMITAAAGLTVESDGNGNVAARTAWLNSHGGAAATDTCTTVTWTHNFTGLANTLPQTVNVTFSASDGCGNSSTTSAAFIIQDTTPPQITTPATDFYGDEGEAAADLAAFLNSHGDATALDIAGPVTWTNNYAGTLPPVGGYITVTFTATDTVGLTASTSCRFFLFPPGAVWIGPATGNWNTAASWRPQIPASTLDTYVDLFDFQNTRVTENITAAVKNLYIGAGDQLDLAGSLTVAGNLISNAGLIRSRAESDITGSARYLVINGQTTLQGPGRFLLAGAARNQVLPGTVAPQELTVAAGQEITTTAETYGGYQGTSIHARLVNHGTLTADGGGLNLYSQPKVNDGVFRAINGGYLEIQPPVDNTGGTVLAGDASTVVLQNTLTGGTVTGLGTMLINAPAGLTGPMLLDTSLTTKFQRWATTLTGTITNNGVMQFGLPDDTSTPYFHINGPVTLEGSGKIIFQGIGRRQILRANNAAADVLTIGAQQEITTDAGTDSNYQSSSIHAGIVNYGTITADRGQLSLYSGLKTNHNLFRAINGGFLDMEADVDNTDGTLFAGPASILHLESTLTGGTITGTGTLLVNTGSALTGPLLLNTGLAPTLDNGATTLTGTITNNTTITFGSNTNTNTAYVVINGAVTLDGTGKIIIQNAGRRQLLRANGAATDVLTLGPGQEITTDSRTGLNYQSSALHAPMVVYGTVTANGGGLTIYSGAKTNNGTMRAINGGYMDFLNVTITNYNAATDTLTGGRWEVVSNGTATTMDLSSMPIATIAAGTTVRLGGAGASLPQLSGLTNISGTLVLENGKTLTTTGNMAIPGVLQYGLPTALEITRLAITGNVNFTGTRVDVLDLGLATGSYLLATWTGTLTGAPVLGSLPQGSQHSLVLGPVAKTLRLEVFVTPQVDITTFTIVPGTGPNAGQDVVTLAGMGYPGAGYIIEASMELVTWVPVSPVLTSPNGALTWEFTQSPALSRRFYRFLLQ